MRDAYTLFDQVVAFSDGHITYEKIRDKLGLVGLERLNALFEACASARTEDVLSMVDEFLQAGISIEQLISNCADYLRSLLLIKSGVKKEVLLGNAPERFSCAVLSAWNTVQIERALSVYLQLYRDIRYSLSPRYELELAFSRLCWLSQYVSAMRLRHCSPVLPQPRLLPLPCSRFLARFNRALPFQRGRLLFRRDFRAFPCWIILPQMTRTGNSTELLDTMEMPESAAPLFLMAVRCRLNNQRKLFLLVLLQGQSLWTSG